MNYQTEEDNIVLGCTVSIFLFIVASVAGWITHIIWVVRMLLSETPPEIGEIVLAILAVIAAPVGVIHGWMIWFGWGWV